MLQFTELFCNLALLATVSFALLWGICLILISLLLSSQICTLMCWSGFVLFLRLRVTWFFSLCALCSVLILFLFAKLMFNRKIVQFWCKIYILWLILFLLLGKWCGSTLLGELGRGRLHPYCRFLGWFGSFLSWSLTLLGFGSSLWLFGRLLTFISR